MAPSAVPTDVIWGRLLFFCEASGGTETSRAEREERCGTVGVAAFLSPAVITDNKNASSSIYTRV